MFFVCLLVFSLGKDLKGYLITTIDQNLSQFNRKDKAIGSLSEPMIFAVMKATFTIERSQRQCLHSSVA